MLKVLKNAPAWKTSKAPAKWPLLEQMLESGCISFLDLAITKRYAESLSEEVAAFFCHLVLATRDGHLCIKVDETGITPSPIDLWKVEDGKNDASDDEQNRLKEMIFIGASTAPDTLVSRCSDSHSLKVVPIICNGAFYYLHKSWNQRSCFLNNLKLVLKSPKPAIDVDLKFAASRLSDLEAEGRLLPEQSAAILKGCEATFTIITGGPGTGKTYTAGMLLRVLWEGLSVHRGDSSSFKVALAAPTGKAAANLEASIAKALSDIPDFPLTSGKTLHQLLKINKEKTAREVTVLSSDIVIVDECSMIDADLMGKLLSSIKPGARLVLLGDRHQLPSVEAGSLFADMTAFIGDKLQFNLDFEGGCHAIELKKCLRSESKAIIQLLEEVRLGNVDSMLHRFDELSANESVAFTQISAAISPKDLQLALIKHALPFIQYDRLDSENASSLFDHFNRFRILTPLRKGPFGSEAINAAIFSATGLNRNSQTPLVIPIMIAKNDYRLGLFNGEVGLLFKYPAIHLSENYAVFPSRSFGGSLRRIPAMLLPGYELAYCLSIHKSQGSEFDHVILSLPEGSESFGRESLYTGASRAKKRLEIWSSPNVVRRMLERTGVRLSGINFLTALN